MRKLLVMTDLHIRAEGQRIIGLDPGARLAEALAHALARHGDAEALVLCGDLTHAGEPAEYQRLRAVLADCPLPVIPMLGNHDNRDAFRTVFPEAPATPEGHVQDVRDIGETWLITLDTLIGPPFGWTHLGRLGPERLAWLDSALAGARDRQVLVCAHHPPMPTGLPAMDSILLEDGAALVDRLLAHDAPAHLILGHLHRTVSGTMRGLPFTVLKGTCHQGPLELVSDDSTLSVDEPGAYGVVLLGPGQVIVHSEDVLATGSALSGYDMA
ncbi:metallophosphoesterase [Frigidibacter sp. ROC022]|uniref:metallophosphoesterase n=1 Tax=Frigidibacter sp. ROC022 TaxID=2971796 RepID=UPI00215A98CC|nr:metallophosphoesterase [Frigidibacter sp. ROC022]MCR8725428.1 metallophosphoesterase [Frigidibacter sp. ROC022]